MENQDIYFPEIPELHFFFVYQQNLIAPDFANQNSSFFFMKSGTVFKKMRAFF